jgi:hypothetical protein
MTKAAAPKPQPQRHGKWQPIKFLMDSKLTAHNDSSQQRSGRLFCKSRGNSDFV